MLCHIRVVIVMPGLVKPCSCQSIRPALSGPLFSLCCPSKNELFIFFLSGYVEIYLQLLFFIKINSVKAIILNFLSVDLM